MSRKLMIDCDEASTICDQTQYCEASFYDKMRLHIHLFLCKNCGLYSKQNKVMSKIFKTHLNQPTHYHLSEIEKKNLKEKIEQQIR